MKHSVMTYQHHIAYLIWVVVGVFLVVDNPYVIITALLGHFGSGMPTSDNLGGGACITGGAPILRDAGIPVGGKPGVTFLAGRWNSSR